MKEVLRQIVKMADIGLIKPDQLNRVMEGVKVVFRSGKAENVVDGIYIMVGGRKHRFDATEIRGIVVDRGVDDPNITALITGMTKITSFIEQHMMRQVKHDELFEDCAIRLLQSYIQWQAGQVGKGALLKRCLEHVEGDLKDEVSKELEHLGLLDSDRQNDRENPAEKTISSAGLEVQTPDTTEKIGDDGSDDLRPTEGQPEGQGRRID
jgi:hypothetical protein